MKTQDFPVEDGVLLTMDYCFISEITIQVPWTKLQSGHINIKIDKVNIVLRPHIQNHDHYKANEGTKQKLKMVTINE